ncbi:DUF2510 domain-containing protein [Pimelobacter simplex]|uniref:DUF2510 domain-containing protein n=1 Tax=Nocardioides simplex TaxID=2045 RepID=UPI003AAEECCA
MEDKSAAAPQVAPGWYPDPQMTNTQRYWDGGRWTEHVAPLARPAVLPFVPAKDNGTLIVAGVVTALLFPIVGFIIGIVLATRNENRGVFIMLGSIGAGIFWFNQLQTNSGFFGGY